MRLKSPLSRIPFSLSLLSLLLLTGVGALTAQAQRGNSPFTDRRAARTADDPIRLLELRDLDLRSGMASPNPAPRPSARFGNALMGSVIGTALGMPLGLVMIRGAMNDESWDEQETNKDHCCGLQRLGLALGGIAVAVGGGPYGAAKRLDRGGVPLYAASVSGEMLLGGLGYALGTTFGEKDRSRIGGLAVGVPLAAIGAAAGAVLGGRASAGMSRAGGLRFREGTWSLGMPDVRVHLPLQTDRSPLVHVTVFSAQID